MLRLSLRCCTMYLSTLVRPNFLCASVALCVSHRNWENFALKLGKPAPGS